MHKVHLRSGCGCPARILNLHLLLHSARLKVLDFAEGDQGATVGHPITLVVLSCWFQTGSMSFFLEGEVLEATWRRPVYMILGRGPGRP